MHFHLQLANHYFAGLYRIDDIVSPLVWGLRTLGHRVTMGILPDLPPWPSAVILLEYFDRDGAITEILNWKRGAAGRACLGLVCTEDLNDALVMEDPRFPRRRANLLQLLPHCDFVWTIIPGGYEEYVAPDRLAFIDYGYVEALRREGWPAAKRDIDVLFYATINDRRRKLYEALEKQGLRVAATRGYLPDYVRYNLMSRSRLVLDVRRGDDVRFTSPSRIAAALQVGSTVVSEFFDTSRLGALYPYTQATEFAAIEERCLALARSPDVVEMGLAARERFKTETSMAGNLRRALALPVFQELAADSAAS
jgi:hypothetical protein